MIERRAKPRRVLIGLGNPWRGDDGVGRVVAASLRGRVAAEVLEQGGDAGALVEALDGRAGAVLVDACASGAAPGTVHRLDAAAGPLPAGLHACSSHGLGVATGVELARALGRLPPECVVYAVEGADFGDGRVLSAPVAAAARSLAARLARELAATAQDGAGV